MTSTPLALRDLDVAAPGFFLRDDYDELLGWLRANDPVHRSANGMVLISRYDDIRDISRRPEAFTSRRGALINDPLRAAEPNDASGSLLHLDPPIHADYRKLLNREFTPRAVARMEQAVRAAVTRAFDAAEAAAGPAGEIDFVDAIASPVPVAVIADLLGMTDHDPAVLRRWSDATIEVSDNPTAEVIEAVTEFAVFLDGHVRQRFRSPGDDLLSLLATSQVGDVPLTPAQVQMFCLTLVVAGNETTRSLLSGGALALWEHPDQRAQLVARLADPARINDAVEECLRWTTPIQAFCRTAVTDGVIAGSPVAAGDYLVLLYASGNRDESVFGPTADRFDVTRAASPAHLAFGFGEHLCLGASLARMEARMVLEELLRRHPTYEVVGDPAYVPSTLTRSLATLRLRLR
jgi:cytochrome P450